MTVDARGVLRVLEGKESSSGHGRAAKGLSKSADRPGACHEQEIVRIRPWLRSFDLRVA
jgi:hypothetical protein